MLRGFFKYYNYRYFSSSLIRKSSEVPKPQETPNTSSSEQRITFSPSGFDKKILVWSGRFKNEESIPSRIGYDTMDNAKSRLRIRLSNILIGVTIIIFCGSVYLGKKKRSEGKTLLSITAEKDQEIIQQRKLKNN